MALTDEAIAAYNTESKQDNHNAAVEHMAEQEAKRIADEYARQFSMQGAWEQLRLKRKPKVLSNIVRQARGNE